MDCHITTANFIKNTGMIDEQCKFFKLKQAQEEIGLLEKLLELNMKDFHDVVEQRDWFYDRYMHYKKISNS